MNASLQTLCMKGNGGFINHTYIIGAALNVNEGCFHSLTDECMKDGQKLTHSLNPLFRLPASIHLPARLRLPESRRVVPELQACSRARAEQ